MMIGITEQFRDNWVLQINGEIDMATGPQLRQRIVQYVQEGHVNIIIDLTEASDFIDSTGLGVLIGGLKRTRSHDGDLQCIGLSESLKEMFKLTGLDAVLTEQDT